MKLGCLNLLYDLLNQILRHLREPGEHSDQGDIYFLWHI